MYISRAKLNLKHVQDSSFWQIINNNYHLHSFVWSLFEDMPNANRDFLYRQDEIKGVPVFYIVSKRKPEVQNESFDLEYKIYEPKLNFGQNLSFVLRANPIVSKREESGKQHRHDVVMDEKYRLKKEGTARNEYPPISEIVQQKGVEWLKRKAETYGFELKDEQVRADGYITRNYYKPKGEHKISLSTIDFTGLLTVTNPELFKQALFEGIGPAKGFGCGLLLVRPVR